MKRLYVGFLVAILILVFGSAGRLGFADERYSQDLADNVTIDAIVSTPSDKMYATYQGKARGFDFEEVAALFLVYPSSPQTITHPRGTRTMLINEADEYLSISLPDKSGTSGVSYRNLSSESNYPWLLIPEVWDAMGFDDGGDLSFMSEAEFVDKCVFLLRTLNPDCDSELVYVYAYNAEKLNSIKQWLYTNDLEYKSFVDNGKITPKERYAEDDEVYRAVFSFKLNGLPLYGNIEPRMSLPYEEAETVAYPMFAEITYGKTGIISFELSGAVQIENQLKEEEILPIADAAKCAARLFDDIILASQVKFIKAFVEYIPVRNGSDSIVLTPTWCFETESSDGDDAGEAYRVNAITGEVIR